MEKMASMVRKLIQKIQQNHFLMYGVPMITLIVGGAYGLKEFRTLKYEVMDQRKQVDPELMEELKRTRKKEEVTLEQAYEKYLEDDLDDWYNIRGPRPWENSKEFQEMQRKNAQKMTSRKVTS